MAWGKFTKSALTLQKPGQGYTRKVLLHNTRVAEKSGNMPPAVSPVPLFLERKPDFLRWPQIVKSLTNDLSSRDYLLKKRFQNRIPNF